MSNSEKKSHFLVDQELIRIRIEAFYIDFIFNITTIQLGAKFSFLSCDGKEEIFNPSSKIGNLSQIWPLIGKKIECVSWNETIEMIFYGGDKIKIHPNDGKLRGTILESDPMVFDDF